MNTPNSSRSYKMRQIQFLLSKTSLMNRKNPKTTTMGMNIRINHPLDTVLGPSLESKKLYEPQLRQKRHLFELIVTYQLCNI